MKRITNCTQLEKLKTGTIIIQLYENGSCDGSKFDIMQINKDKIKTLCEVGGKKKNINKLRNIRGCGVYIEENKISCKVYVADAWMQKLYN